MRKQYDFSNAKKNRQAKRLKKPVAIRLDESTVACFKTPAEDTEQSSQRQINGV